MKFKTKPFDLEKAKAGAEVVTRDGTPVRIICYDAAGSHPIVALINYGDNDIACMYNENGSFSLGEECNGDLMIKEKPWRADYDAKYHFVTSSGSIGTDTEYGALSDDKKYEFGNYFKTEEEAQIVLSEIREVLAKHRK